MINPTDPIQSASLTYPDLNTERLYVNGVLIAQNVGVKQNKPLKQICAILNTYSAIHKATISKIQQEADNDGQQHDTE